MLLQVQTIDGFRKWRSAAAAEAMILSVIRVVKQLRLRASFYLTCDCSGWLWGSANIPLRNNNSHTTTRVQQQRMTQNGHNQFCNKSENFWMTRKQRGRGGIVCGPELSCVAEADRTNAESDWGFISHTMYRRSCPGLNSKWELVHYGSAARYLTRHQDGGCSSVNCCCSVGRFRFFSACV